MKRFFTIVTFTLLLLQSMTGQDLLISGIFDGPLPGALPRGVELYVINDIPDLSIYGIGKSTNGDPTAPQGYTFPATGATAGDFIYVTTEISNFNTFFGFDPDFTTSEVNNNGDDVIVLYSNGVEIDAYGELGVDGTGQTWDFLDGWAYRIDGTGPDGIAFADVNWTYSGINIYDGVATNADAVPPFPIGTYSPVGSMALEVSFEQSGITVDENIGQLMVTVNILNPDAVNPTSVDVTLGAGSTASDGADFAYTTTTVTFPAGSSDPQMISIAIIDDADAELAETVVLELTNPTNGAALGLQTDYTITITVNDAPAVTTDLVLTEIMYNPPESGTDSLEYIEIYNKGTMDIDMTGYTMSGVNYTFGAFTLTSGSYVLLGPNVTALTNNLNTNSATVLEWDSGSTNNNGELIQILDTFGSVIDEVDYDDSAPWPTSPDEDGPSLELCDVNADNNAAENWMASSTATGVIINGNEIFGTPGAANFCPVPSPTLDFASVTYSVNELDGSIDLEITIIDADANDTSVDIILLAGGTATESADFTFADTLTVTFPANSTNSQFIDIPITDDLDLEGDETFTLALDNPTNNAAIGPNGETTVTIIDNDFINPVVAFDTTTMTVNELDGTVLVDLGIIDADSVATSVDVIIVAAMTDADGVTDYTLADTTTITFPANDASNQPLSIDLVNDTVIEDMDTLFLQLINPTNDATIGADSTFTLIINDDDAAMQGNAMLISGVFDGPLSGGTKAVELYILEDIIDISRYGIGAANNGGGTDGIEFTFPAVSASAGDCITITNNQVNYMQYFGFPADYEDGTSTGINGNDAIELFLDTMVVDVFGDIDDGSGAAWDYEDGWAYRKNQTGPDGDVFVIANWTFTGPNVLDDDTLNTTSNEMFPNCTYNPNPPAVPEFTFDSPAYTIGEDGMSVDVEILASEPVDCTVEVVLDPSTTAMNGDDFTFTDPTIVTFTLAGPTTETLNIPILEDFLSEGNESIKLQLVAPSTGCAIGVAGNTTINIIDNDYTVYDIATVTTEDVTGVADSSGTRAELTGIVHYINYVSNNRLDFTLIDATGGIALFSFDNYWNYLPIPGDELMIQGVIGQYAGLTQIMPHNLVVLSSGNQLDQAVPVTALSELTESDVIRMECMTLVDTAQWTTGMGNSGFSVDISDGMSTFELVINRNVPLYNEPAPLGYFHIQGIGRQLSSNFNTPPFLDGYRIFGHQVTDANSVCPVANADYFANEEIRLYPNPTEDRLTVETELTIEILRITNILGQFVAERTDFEGAINLDVSKLPAGVYQATFVAQGQSHTLQFIRK